MDRLNGMNEKIKVFYAMATVLDDATIKICKLSKKFQVYSELNMHLWPEKVKEIDAMKAMFPQIEELKHLKGPISDDEDAVICISYDGINHADTSPIWYKFDKSLNEWVWSP